MMVNKGFLWRGSHGCGRRSAMLEGTGIRRRGGAFDGATAARLEILARKRSRRAGRRRTALTACAAATTKQMTPPHRPDSRADLCDRPDFWRISHARHRQGRLRAIFCCRARHSGGVLRRRAEVRRGDLEGPRRYRRARQARCRGLQLQGQERLDARYPGAGRSQGRPADRDRHRQAGRHQGNRNAQIRRRAGRQDAWRRIGDGDGRAAGRRDERGAGSLARLRRSAARLCLRSL